LKLAFGVKVRSTLWYFSFIRLELATVLNDLTLARDQFCQFWFGFAGIDFLILKSDAVSILKPCYSPTRLHGLITVSVDHAMQI